MGVETGALVDVSGLDRESSAGGRGRPRPRVLSWWTWTALTECPQLADVDGLDRVSPAGRRGRGRVPPSCVGYRVLRRSPVYRA